MIFSDLIKAAAHKYIKRVPKGGGGFTYFYRETGGGGVALKEHMKEGAAFKLTHEGKTGHFHIKAVDGDQVSVEHDESGAKATMTRDDLAALLRAHHAPALKRQVERAERQAARAAERLTAAKRLAGEAAPAPAPAPAPTEEAPAPARVREDNFETMPESEGADYTSTDKPLGKAARAALRADLSAALLAGEEARVGELYTRQDIDATRTNNAPVDALLAAFIGEAPAAQEIDGTRRRQKRGKASADLSATLAAAAASGALVETDTPNGAKVYTPSAASAIRAPNHAWSVTVLGDRYEFKLDDFGQPNEHNGAPAVTPDELSAQEQREPARKDAAKVDALLDQIEALVKANPALANNPRVIALLGSAEEPKREGREVGLILPGLKGEPERQRARYMLIEAGDAVASHNPLSFAPRADYPEGVQERPYHQERAEQLKVERNTTLFNPDFLVNTNPDATNGAPIITPEGLVLGGNSRVMTLQRVYSMRPDHARAYKAKLKEEAASFGFTGADIDALKAPMLVRVYDPPADDAKTLSRLVRAANVNKTQGMEGRIKGRALASQLSADTLNTLKLSLANAPEDYSINRFLTKPSNALTAFIEALARDGILNPQNGVEYLRPDKTLNGTGRDLVQNALIGYVVRDEQLLASMDYSTFENLSIAVGKLAAHGLSDQIKTSLTDAIRVYNYALQREAIRPRMDAAQRDANMRDFIRSTSFMFTEDEPEGSLASERDIERAMFKVNDDPLANSFLRIFTLNPTANALNDTIDQFIKLTTAEANDDLFGEATLDYKGAADELNERLATTHKLSAAARGPYTRAR